MSDLANIVAHYLEVIVKRTGLNGFEEMRAEIEAAAQADEQRIRLAYEPRSRAPDDDCSRFTEGCK